MKSIMSKDRRCYICGSSWVELHHIYAGAFRKKSDKYGCTVYLCPYHHRLQGGVGYNNPIKEIDQFLRKECQKQFEEIYGHELFMKVFRRNYL